MGFIPIPHSYDWYSARIRSAKLGELTALRLMIIMDKRLNDEECLQLCQMLNSVVQVVATAPCDGEPEIC